MTEAKDKMGFFPIRVIIEGEHLNFRADTSSVSIFALSPEP